MVWDHGLNPLLSTENPRNKGFLGLGRPFLDLVSQTPRLPLLVDNWQCKCLMCCIFPVLKPCACGRPWRCPGWAYKLPGGQKFSIQLSSLSVAFPQRTPFKFNKKTAVYKLHRGAIYKPPCVQLINHPFFAIHQVFALSIFMGSGIFLICVAFRDVVFEKALAETRLFKGCGFFVYSWKLPAYSGVFYLQLTILAFLITVGAFLLTVLASLLTVEAFLLTVGSASSKGLKGL